MTRSWPASSRNRPDPAFLHRTKFLAAFGKEDFTQALVELDGALKLVPGHPLYLSFRAMALCQMGRLSEAHADLQAALARDSSLKEAHTVSEAFQVDALQSRNRARELAKKGRMSDALPLLDRAAALEPGNALNFLFRCLTRTKVGEHVAAVEDLRHALELDPANAEARNVLQALERQAGPADAAPAQRSSPSRFYLMASGNPSVIAAVHAILRDEAEVPAALYRASPQALRELRAAARGPFGGAEWFGERKEPVEGMEDLARRIGAGATGDVHIVVIPVPDEPKLERMLEGFYQETMRSAARQGILPFPMFVTSRGEARDLLVRFLEPVQP